MTKQEFLAMSLPFNAIVCVKYTHKPDSSEYENLIGLIDGRVITGETEDDDPLLPISDYRVILHPLSDLTKEIEHKGEKFVPIEKLGNKFSVGKCSLYPTTLDMNTYETYSINILAYFNIFQKLIEWHFDIAGLIEKGEAIDVNTLSENPYK